MKTVVEICAGAGGMALGFEEAGLEHVALIEVDKWACETLRHNRPDWPVHEGDANDWSPEGYLGVDVLAGGVPCPPFSAAGKQLGGDDERDMFPRLVSLAEALRPRCVVVENVRGLMAPKFDGYRAGVETEIVSLGYHVSWRVLQASDYGVPQVRPRTIMFAAKPHVMARFSWPTPTVSTAVTVGEALADLMGAGGWEGVGEWATSANKPAPTLVGGSKKHGGPDLGPTRARQAWVNLGVEGRTIAATPPGPGHEGMPRLTVPMAARIQGFPDNWEFAGAKTHAYRQVGNAFPPPVARALGASILEALDG